MRNQIILKPLKSPEKLSIDKGFIGLETFVNKKYSLRGGAKIPVLIINSLLQTVKVKSTLHEAKGLVRQRNGKTKLVGIATIPRTGNKILDIFLDLPNEALAELNCEIK